MFAEQHNVGVGIILRNDQGEVIMTASKREIEVNDHIEIEFLAILRGLQLSVHLGIKYLIVESDSLTLMKEFQLTTYSMSCWAK